MPSRIRLCLLLLSAVVFSAARVSAQSTAPPTDTFRAGLKSFTIPAPSSELVEPGSDYRVLLEPLAANTNRLIAGFITSDELNALRSSAGTQLKRYALVEVPRRAEFTEVTPEIFKQVVESVGAQFGASIDANLKDQEAEVNRRIKDLGASKTVTLEKPVQLGAFFTKPDAASYGMVMPITVDGVAKKVAMSMIVIRIQQRMLFLYVFDEYKDESSVQWVRATGEHWTDATLQANK
jgi:hypothetical protein